LEQSTDLPCIRVGKGEKTGDAYHHKHLQNGIFSEFAGLSESTPSDVRLNEECSKYTLQQYKDTFVIITQVARDFLLLAP